MLAAVFFAFLTAVPVAVLLSSFLQPVPDIWEHLNRYVLGSVIRNTLCLVSAVCLATFLLGAGLASLISFTDFPGKRFFDRALLLPLVMPAYVLAFVYVGSFDYAGPVLTRLRSLGIDSAMMPPIRSFGGVVLVMSLAFYPYVYLTVRQAYLSQSRSAAEAARSLGLSELQVFFRVLLPMARPWIAAGLMLVAMETLADFGTVTIFNFDTFTTVIYKTWYGFFSITGAAQLSSLLLAAVMLFFVCEQHFRRHARFWHTGKKVAPAAPAVLQGGLAWSAFLACFMTLTAGFVFPVLQLLSWGIQHFRADFDSRYAAYFIRTVGVSLCAALLVVTAGLVLAYAGRRHPGPGVSSLIRFSTLGYAIPGAVLAVGIVVSCSWIERFLGSFFHFLFQKESVFILTQTLAVMQIAYLVRFLTVAYSPIESAMLRLPLRYDETARSLGVTGTDVLRKVHLPLLKTGLISAGILVFVEVMKEMPMTLMTRPFGWDTLAVRIFEMTSEGEWERAALPAIALVLCGFLPLFMLPGHSPVYRKEV